MSSVYYHNTTGWAVFSIQTGSRQSSEHEQCVLSQHYRLGCISIQTGSRQSSEHEQCVFSQHYRLGCISIQTGSRQSSEHEQCVLIHSAPTCSVVIYIGLAQTSHKCHMTHTSSEHALTSDNQQGNVDTIVRTPCTVTCSQNPPHHMHAMGKCVVGGAERGRGVKYVGFIG